MKLVDQILPATPGVYRITNTLNGRCYVGSSKKIRHRYQQHKAQLVAGTHHSPKLRSSVKKYGVEVFSFEVLEECTEHQLLEREAHWMGVHNAVDGGYNIRRDPSSNLGIVATAETRAKLSRLHKGRKATDAARANLSLAAKGRDMSAQVKISADRRRGKPLPEATRLKMSAALRGRKITPEHAAQVAAANRGRVVSAETRKKISEAQMGRKMSEASLAMRVGRKQSKETVAKRVEKMLGVPQTKEHIAKRVAAVAATKGVQVVGVSWHKGKQKWRARITADGREKALGYFTNYECAVAARRAAEATALEFV